MNWSAFFAMGGYAVYVWPAYAVATVVLAGLVIVSLRFRYEQKRLLAEAGELAAAENPSNGG